MGAADQRSSSHKRRREHDSPPRRKEGSPQRRRTPDRRGSPDHSRRRSPDRGSPHHRRAVRDSSPPHRRRDHHQEGHEHRRGAGRAAEEARPSRDHNWDKQQEEPVKDDNDQWGAKGEALQAPVPGGADEQEPQAAPEPDFGLSGKLAAETNTVKGVVLLHTEPPEAASPTLRWRLYIFKNGEPFGDPLYIHRQSCYLFGRERRVCDVATDHLSCSKQHAVLQYRSTQKAAPDGLLQSAVRPYLMDLGSTNGTYLNSERLEPQRYYELLEKDMIRFGNSSREYVLLHEKSGT